VSNAAKLLDQMRRNPLDWRIDELRLVAERNGLTVQQGKGSHVKFSHSSLPTILAIPAGRPIKPIYVTRLISLIDKVNQTP